LQDWIPVGGVMFATVQVPPEELAVTVYDVATPSATKVAATVCAPLSATVGGASAVPVVYVPDAALTPAVSPLPVGVTVKVYPVVSARPVTMQCWVPVGGVTVFATEQVKLVGVEVTV
jgi:hypothetical protein